MKAFRLDPNTAVLLCETAKRLGVSETEYVSKMLKRDLMLEPLIQNIGGIGLSRALFQGIISRTDSNSLEILGFEIAKDNLRFAFELLGLELNFTSVIRFMKEVLQANGWFKMESLTADAYLEFRLIHNYNYRWSVFLRSCLSSMFEFIPEEPTFVISDRVVKLKLLREPILDLEQRNALLNSS
jgi:hypothetical protein